MAWLESPAESAMETVAPMPSEFLEAWPVSTAVNNPNFNDARLLEPIKLDA